MRETGYSKELRGRLEDLFPGCMILRGDANRRQGIPDLLLLFEDKWAALEVKAAWNSPEQPNQEYYVNLMDNMSFAAIIFPENEEDVLRDLQRAFRHRRSTRIPQRQ